MCDQAVRDMLEQTVRDFMDGGQPFTAYDVTVKTRQREGIELLHRKVRDDVHRIIQDTLAMYEDETFYDNTQIKTPSGEPVILYHPEDFDVADYQFQSTSRPMPQPVKTTTQADLDAIFGKSTPPTPVAPPWVNKPSDGTFDIDYRNRLMVPTQFFRELGIKPDDTVFVLADTATNSVRISANSQPNARAYVVEPDGDLRLSGKALGAAGLFESKYRIATKDDSGSRVIEITKA